MGEPGKVLLQIRRQLEEDRPEAISQGRGHLIEVRDRLARVFDAAFGSKLNPLRNLGSLGFLFFWLLAISGIYVYAVLDTSATGAYLSIDRLSRTQWYLGGILRSVHRYAADSFRAENRAVFDHRQTLTD